MSVPDSAPAPVRIDEAGFRIPDAGRPGGSKEDSQSRSLLALGDSLTFGAYASQEVTFSEIVGREMRLKVYNAGVCGAGLAQMLMLAEKHIPAYKPSVVLVQYSPWLAKRSMSPFAEMLETLPVPYFTDQGGGAFKLQKPVFTTGLLDKSFTRYIDSRRGPRDFLSFFFHAGLPLILPYDSHITRFRIAEITGAAPRPASDEQRLLLFVYNRIESLCRQYGARMVIVILDRVSVAKPEEYRNRRMPQMNLEGNRTLSSIKSAAAADANSALIEALPEKDYLSYTEAYCFWRSNPRVMFDCHPNERAHAVISESILKSLKSQQPGKSVVK